MREGVPDQPGATGRRYRIERLIGTGGAAVVYEARRLGPKGSGECVACKLVRTPRREESRQYELVWQEALLGLRVAAGHPNVVEIRDFFHDAKQQLCIVMELVEGASAAELHGPELGLPPAIVRRIACDVLEGLAHVHGRGVLHRDLSLRNILVTTDGVAKLTDFGIARELRDGKVETNTLRGTPMYLSPEAIHGLAQDVRADLFMLGAVLYDLVTGAPPCGHQDMIGPMLARNVKGDFAPLPPDTPADLAELITGLIQVDRDRRRPCTAAEALALLRERGEPMASRAELAALVAAAQSRCEPMVAAVRPAEVLPAGYVLVAQRIGAAERDADRASEAPADAQPEPEHEHENDPAGESAGEARPEDDGEPAGESAGEARPEDDGEPAGESAGEARREDDGEPAGESAGEARREGDGEPAGESAGEARREGGAELAAALAQALGGHGDRAAELAQALAAQDGELASALAQALGAHGGDLAAVLTEALAERDDDRAGDAVPEPVDDPPPAGVPEPVDDPPPAGVVGRVVNAYAGGMAGAAPGHPVGHGRRRVTRDVPAQGRSLTRRIALGAAIVACVACAVALGVFVVDGFRPEPPAIEQQPIEPPAPVAEPAPPVALVPIVSKRPENRDDLAETTPPRAPERASERHRKPVGRRPRVRLFGPEPTPWEPVPLRGEPPGGGSQ